MKDTAYLTIKIIDMNLFDPIKSIMSTKLITVSQNDPIELLTEIFSKNRFHHVLVVEESKLIGIVSRIDLKLFLNINKKESKEKKRLEKHKVSEIMTSKVATIGPDEKIIIALEVFKENILRALPVVIDQFPVGIITTYDIINKLAQDQKAESSYNL